MAASVVLQHTHTHTRKQCPFGFCLSVLAAGAFAFNIVNNPTRLAFMHSNVRLKLMHLPLGNFSGGRKGKTGDRSDQKSWPLSMVYDLNVLPRVSPLCGLL